MKDQPLTIEFLTQQVQKRNALLRQPIVIVQHDDGFVEVYGRKGQRVKIVRLEAGSEYISGLDEHMLDVTMPMYSRRPNLSTDELLVEHVADRLTRRARLRQVLEKLSCKSESTPKETAESASPKPN